MAKITDTTASFNNNWRYFLVIRHLCFDLIKKKLYIFYFPPLFRINGRIDQLKLVKMCNFFH